MGSLSQLDTLKKLLHKEIQLKTALNKLATELLAGACHR